MWPFLQILPWERFSMEKRIHSPCGHWVERNKHGYLDRCPSFYFPLRIILIACFACKNYMCSLFFKIFKQNRQEESRKLKKKIPQSNLVSWIIVDNEESILPTLSLCPNKIGVAISAVRLYSK